MTDPDFKELDWKNPRRSILPEQEETPKVSNKKIVHYRESLAMRLSLIFILLFCITFLLDDFTGRNDITLSNVALGETPQSKTVEIEKITEEVMAPSVNAPPPPTSDEDFLLESEKETYKNEEFQVQAVLGTKRKVVIASGIDAKITKFKLESGDTFKKGDVLIEYDCSMDHARLKEATSRQRVTEKQLSAFTELRKMQSVSDIELVVAHENNEQNKALISQIKARLKSCQHVAPWNGRVMRKLASQYEYVQTGRVLTEIASNEPLRAEFLVPSSWLQWLNVNTPVNIFINETEKNYSAKIINIFGEVDPVSQSIQIVAEMEKYHEELLPGMSGSATFSNRTIEQGEGNGFLGLRLAGQ